MAYLVRNEEEQQSGPEQKAQRPKSDRADPNDAASMMSDQAMLLPHVTLQPQVPEAVKVAVEQLKDDLISLNDSKDHVAFLMAVNVNTAKAELVPIPTLANMVKLKEHLEQFPDGVKSALKKNISDEDMMAVESIWHFLEKSKVIPLPASKSK